MRLDQRFISGSGGNFVHHLLTLYCSEVAIGPDYDSFTVLVFRTLRSGMIFSAWFKKLVMETTITSKLDRAIEQYRVQHNGSNPLYCIMSAEEADELADAMRQEKGQNPNVINTSYQDIKIIRNSLMERGQYVLSNELPETGS
jgi:hypothetical protein